jgi:pilus assembly protein CpaF
MEAFVGYVADLAASQELLKMAPSGRAAGDRRSGEGRRGDGSTGPTTVDRSVESAELRTKRDARDRLKADVHEALATKLDMVVASRASDADRLAELRGQVSSTVMEILQDRTDLGTAEEVVKLRQEIVDEALGFGPLEDLLRDPNVSEIMVNGCENVYVERGGKLERSVKRFTNNAQLRLVIERMIAPIGRRIDESSPLVDARLADGSRVNAVIEPLAIDGPTLTIRRFGSRRLAMEDLVRLGAVSENVVEFLRAIVEARLNIVISGGTGSGKTTFLNILSGYIPQGERIVTIEDAAELRLDQEHVVRLEARPANLQGKGEVQIRDLMKNALRMRPDRIIVGECRSGEALDMLQAMNTGHDGSLTTAHANTARDALSRIETMVLMAGFELPIKAIREQVSSAIDIIVQISRLRDGSRKVMSITEVVGMEGDIITLQDLMLFREQGLDKLGKVVGTFEFTGVQPYCIKRFEELGISFDMRSFSGKREPELTWSRILKALTPLTETYSLGLVQAGINIRPQDLVIGIVTAAVVGWIAIMVFLKPEPLQGLIALPVLLLVAFGVCRIIVRRLIARRLAIFTNQLELVLRLMVSGLRAGLSIRQALTMVVEQSPDPARHEFMRVIGQTNIGISMYDALDQLAQRLTSNEMTMLTRAIRLQSQTGGNLAKVLEQLATTIKERRRLHRKIKAITSEGRATGTIISALPVGVGIIIMLTNPNMRDATLNTQIGHLSLGLAAALEGIGAFILMSMVKVDV